MNGSSTRREQWLDLIAAEYVIGTLRGAARRRMQRWIQDDAAVRDAVRRWEQRLYRLAAVAPVPPSATLWSRVTAQLPEFGAAVDRPPPAANDAIAQPDIQPRRQERRGRRGRVFTRWAAAAVLAAIVVGLVYQLRPVTAPTPPVRQAQVQHNQFVASLGPKNATPYWRVSVNLSTHKMQATTLSTPAIPAGRAPELWLIPRGGKPIPMGMLPNHASKQGPLPSLPKGMRVEGAKLAVSLEPPGGSPTGAPTGPVVFVAPLTRVS